MEKKKKSIKLQGGFEAEKSVNKCNNQLVENVILTCERAGALTRTAGPEPFAARQSIITSR